MKTYSVSRRCLLLAMVISAFTLCLPKADILELKNRNILNGKYAGGTQDSVRFDTTAGLQVVPTDQIVALTFTAPVPPPAPIAPPVVAQLPAKIAVTLPPGTTLLVRLSDPVSSRNKAGASFSTRLEYDLVVNGVKVVPAGATIYGKVQSSTQAGRALGRSTLDIRLTQIVLNGSPIPIATSGHKEAGQASIAKAAKGAAAGAAIGAIAGDAGKGAAIGATAGALVRGQTITITPGTLLEFDLTQPITISPAQ